MGVGGKCTAQQHLEFILEANQQFHKKVYKFCIQQPENFEMIITASY